MPTSKRDEILNFILGFRFEHGYSPTMQEIGQGVGLHSRATVKAHLDKLVRLGKITMQPGQPRTIVPAPASNPYIVSTPPLHQNHWMAYGGDPVIQGLINSGNRP